MKIVVVGASGLIGSKVSAILTAQGFDVIAASPRFGINTLTGKGLDKAMAGADVVIDLVNAPSFETKTAMDFFTRSTANLLQAELSANISHHIALSVVGVERLGEIGYFRAKQMQERLIERSSIPYTIVHSTQSFEFIESIVRSAEMEDEAIFLPAVYFQPISSDDIAAVVADVSYGHPRNGIVEIAGPAPLRLPEIVQRYLNCRSDPRVVRTDIHAPYFGGEIEAGSLMPGDAARLGQRTFESWLACL